MSSEMDRPQVKCACNAASKRGCLSIVSSRQGGRKNPPLPPTQNHGYRALPSTTARYKLLHGTLTRT